MHQSCASRRVLNLTGSMSGPLTTKWPCWYRMVRTVICFYSIFLLLPFHGFTWPGAMPPCLHVRKPCPSGDSANAVAKRRFMIPRPPIGLIDAGHHDLPALQERPNHFLKRAKSLAVFERKSCLHV